MIVRQEPVGTVLAKKCLVPVEREPHVGTVDLFFNCKVPGHGQEVIQDDIVARSRPEIEQVGSSGNLKPKRIFGHESGSVSCGSETSNGKAGGKALVHCGRPHLIGKLVKSVCAQAGTDGRMIQPGVDALLT